MKQANPIDIQISGGTPEFRRWAKNIAFLKYKGQYLTLPDCIDYELKTGKDSLQMTKEEAMDILKKKAGE